MNWKSFSYNMLSVTDKAVGTSGLPSVGEPSSGLAYGNPRVQLNNAHEIYDDRLNMWYGGNNVWESGKLAEIDHVKHSVYWFEDMIGYLMDKTIDIKLITLSRNNGGFTIRRIKFVVTNEDEFVRKEKSRTDGN